MAKIKARYRQIFDFWRRIPPSGNTRPLDLLRSGGAAWATELPNRMDHGVNFHFFLKEYNHLRKTKEQVRKEKQKI